jgi:hypothetical protein
MMKINRYRITAWSVGTTDPTGDLGWGAEFSVPSPQIGVRNQI